MDYTNYRGFNLNRTAFPVKEYGFKVTRKFWSGENRERSYQLTAGMVDDMCANKKDSLPIVNFKTMKEFACVIADFDILPPEFETFDSFFSFLYKNYPTACVTRSASNKVKVIFLVEKMLHIDYLRTLKSLIDESLHKYLDTSPSALNTTLFNEAMYADIYKWLKTAIPHESLGKEFSEIQCDQLSQLYVDTNNRLCDLLVDAGFTTKQFRCLTEPKLQQLGMQLMTSALDLCQEGCMWNQEIFAKVLGLKSPRTAAKLLDKLVEVGFIELVANYSAGYKSRTYKAVGKLLAFFTEHGLHTTKATTIENGNTIKTHKINALIASILPPAQEANRYYIKISNILIKNGVPVETTLKILYDIDRRRPKIKQRSKGYFKTLTTWSHRKINGKNI